LKEISDHSGDLLAHRASALVVEAPTSTEQRCNLNQIFLTHSSRQQAPFGEIHPSTSSVFKNVTTDVGELRGNAQIDGMTPVTRIYPPHDPAVHDADGASDSEAVGEKPDVIFK